MIRWQGRRNRARSGVSLWTVVLAVSALTGAAAMGAQAMGWIQLSGFAGFVPGLLLLFAVSMQAVTVLRAAVRWLAG